jgi:hypothetical protein
VRVLISVDMEGIAGVVHVDDIRPGHPEYERNRRLLTLETNAAIRGVYAHHPGAQVLVPVEDLGRYVDDVLEGRVAVESKYDADTGWTLSAVPSSTIGPAAL